MRLRARLLALALLIAAAGCALTVYDAGARRAPAPTPWPARASDDIPDFVAAEAFLRSIVAPENNERAEARARASLERAGLGLEGEYWAEKDARRALDEIRPLDREAARLKNRHWPDPPGSVIRELERLQRRKEQIVESAMARIGSTSARAQGNRLEHLLGSEIKSRIRRADPERPGRHHRVGSNLFSGLLRLEPAAAAQASTIGGAYLYMEGGLMDGAYYYAYGAVLEQYSSYGHNYEVTLHLRTPDGRSDTRTFGRGEAPVAAELYLPAEGEDGLLYHGEYFLSSGARGNCPYSGEEFSLGSQQSTRQAKPFLTIDDWVEGWTKDKVSLDEETKTHFKARMSTSVGGSLEVYDFVNLSSLEHCRQSILARGCELPGGEIRFEKTSGNNFRMRAGSQNDIWVGYRMTYYSDPSAPPFWSRPRVRTGALTPGVEIVFGPGARRHPGGIHSAPGSFARFYFGGR